MQTFYIKTQPFIQEEMNLFKVTYFFLSIEQRLSITNSLTMQNFSLVCREACWGIKK